MRLTSVSLAAATLFSTAFAADVKYQFNVVNAAVSPDGYSRQAVLVNGIYPGTTITANKGDTLYVNVTNMLTDPTMRRSTTIHWHGLSRPGPRPRMVLLLLPNARFRPSFPINTRSRWATRPGPTGTTLISVVSTSTVYAER